MTWNEVLKLLIDLAAPAIGVAMMFWASRIGIRNKKMEVRVKADEQNIDNDRILLAQSTSTLDFLMKRVAAQELKIATLEQKVEVLQYENTQIPSLKARIVYLEDSNALLQKENSELKNQMATLINQSLG